MRAPILAFLLVLLAGSSQAEPLDLSARVREHCGAEGHRRGAACRLTLPPGEHEITETALGPCTDGNAVRPGLEIVGAGPAAPMTAVPRFSEGETTLRYAGPEGGVMLSLCGSMISVRDLTIDGRGAGVVIRRTSRNAAGATSHVGTVENVVIDGGGLALEVTGAAHDDQTDLQVYRNLIVREVDTCFEQDTGQAVGTHVSGIDCAARRTGYRVRAGSAHFERAYAGQRALADGSYDPGFIAYHLTRSARQGGFRHAVTIRDAHIEVHSGRFLVDDSESFFGLRVEGGLWQLLGPHLARFRVLDLVSSGQVVVDGLSLSSAGGIRQEGRACRLGGPLEMRAFSLAPQTAGLRWDLECGKR